MTYLQLKCKFISKKDFCRDFIASSVIGVEKNILNHHFLLFFNWFTQKMQTQIEKVISYMQEHTRESRRRFSQVSPAI